VAQPVKRFQPRRPPLETSSASHSRCRHADRTFVSVFTKAQRRASERSSVGPAAPRHFSHQRQWLAAPTPTKLHQRTRHAAQLRDVVRSSSSTAPLPSSVHLALHPRTRGAQLHQQRVHLLVHGRLGSQPRADYQAGSGEGSHRHCHVRTHFVSFATPFALSLPSPNCEVCCLRRSACPETGDRCFAPSLSAQNATLRLTSDTPGRWAFPMDRSLS
jgi:hypothetical protein